MKTVVMGKTGLTINKNGFGALPIQRVPRDDAVYLLQKAFDNGINYFDSARGYSDSEEKLGAAFSQTRAGIVISTKTAARTVEGFREDLCRSLAALRTDYIDIYQFHNPDFCPGPGDASGLYEAMTQAKREGKIRFIGITSHRLAVASEAIASGLYDTLQFPFSYLAGDAELRLVQGCREQNIGFIAMKALSGGLITNSAAAYAYMAEFDHVEPIWGIQRESELDEFLSYNSRPPALTDEIIARIERDRKELAGEFCRGCGYCMPCPAGIKISTCARMSLLLRRSPRQTWLSEEWRNEMEKIADCQHCNRCMSKCPYGLNTPQLLQKNYEDYRLQKA